VLLTNVAFAVGVIALGRSKTLVQSLPSIESLARVDVLCVDKTGTITEGKPSVTDIISLNNKFSKEDILRYAASAEKMSEHPLGEAIVNASTNKSVSLITPNKFKAIEGKIARLTANNS
jgi:Cu+-exporting ATPase